MIRGHSFLESELDNGPCVPTTNFSLNSFSDLGKIVHFNYFKIFCHKDVPNIVPANQIDNSSIILIFLFKTSLIMSIIITHLMSCKNTIG